MHARLVFLQRGLGEVDHSRLIRVVPATLRLSKASGRLSRLSRRDGFKSHVDVCHLNRDVSQLCRSRPMSRVASSTYWVHFSKRV